MVNISRNHFKTSMDIKLDEKLKLNINPIKKIMTKKSNNEDSSYNNTANITCKPDINDLIKKVIRGHRKDSNSKKHSIDNILLPKSSNQNSRSFHSNAYSSL